MTQHFYPDDCIPERWMDASPTTCTVDSQRERTTGRAVSYVAGNTTRAGRRNASRLGTTQAVMRTFTVRDQYEYTKQHPLRGPDQDPPIHRDAADDVLAPVYTDNHNTHNLTHETEQMFYVDLQAPFGDVPYRSDSGLLETSDSNGSFVKHEAQVAWDAQ